MSEGKDTDLTPPGWLAEEHLGQWEIIAQNKEEAEKMKKLAEKPSEQEFFEAYNRSKPKPSLNEEAPEVQEKMQKISSDGVDKIERCGKRRSYYGGQIRLESGRR